MMRENLIMKVVKFGMMRLLPLGVLLIALFFGWLSRFDIPEGVLIAMLYPLGKGYMPPIITGGYKECPVPPVLSLSLYSSIKEGEGQQQEQEEADETEQQERRQQQLKQLRSHVKPRPSQETFVKLVGAPQEDDNTQTHRKKVKKKNNNKDMTSSEFYKYNMPQQGLGMCCRYTAYDTESVKRTVLHYLLLGGRHIDTADLYMNHVPIGEALQIAMNVYGISRDEIWITTKLWTRFYGYNSTLLEAIPRYLQELQLDYIDLILMHSPNHNISPVGGLGKKESECKTRKLSPSQCRIETWMALSQAKQLGLVNHVGVSNFNIRQMQELIELEQSTQVDNDAASDIGEENTTTTTSTIETDDNETTTESANETASAQPEVSETPATASPIAVNQFQFNPWAPEHNQEIFDFCQEHNIVVTAWSSLQGTYLQKFHALTAFQNLTQIAENHHSTVAQVLLSWAMQKGAVVIPGTANPKHMEENLNAFELHLTPQNMETITALKDDEESAKFFFQPTDDS